MMLLNSTAEIQNLVEPVLQDQKKHTRFLVWPHYLLLLFNYHRRLGPPSRLDYPSSSSLPSSGLL